MHRASLTSAQRQEIRDMRQANPRLRYKVIAGKFGCSMAYISDIISGRANHKKPVPPERMALPPSPPKSPLISWTPDLKRLTAGR